MRIRCVLALLLLATVPRLPTIEESGFEELQPSGVKPYFATAPLGSFAGVDGIQIRDAALEAENERGALVILPGRSETFSQYAELVYDHRDLGFSFNLDDQVCILVILDTPVLDPSRLGAGASSWRGTRHSVDGKMSGIARGQTCYFRGNRPP